MAIVVNKTDSGNSNVGTKKEPDIINILTPSIQNMCKELIVPQSEFEPEKFADILSEYIKDNQRILYTPISDFIYMCYEEHSLTEADQLLDDMVGNIESVLEYVNQPDYQRKITAERNPGKKQAMRDAKKSVLKIWDHANLANKQYHTLKQTDDEFRTKFDERFDKSFEERFDPTFKEEFANSMTPEKENLTKEMNAQLITMVGIFTALAFLIFGGISSLDNLFTSENISIPRLMIIGSVWGLCILNLVFVFLFCVGKMTKLNFKSTDDKTASIFRKYPIVWWCNFAIMLVLGGSIWIYYITTRDGLGWLDEFCNKYPQSFTIVGSIIFIIVFIILAVVLGNLTRHKEITDQNSVKELDSPNTYIKANIAIQTGEKGKNAIKKSTRTRRKSRKR